MEVQQIEQGNVSVDVENIGGIESASVTFSPGVTILEGRNATNRTSFLQAVMAALGSENVSIKGDADEATVELTLGDETYTRHLSRKGKSIVSEGDRYLDNPTVADLFAFLLESNEARRAVANNDDLRDLIMRPVDTEEIQAEIDRLTKRRQQLENELEEIEDLKGELPDLEQERAPLEEKIEEKKTELEEKEDELANADVDIEETRAEKAELEDNLEKLRTKRSELEDIRYDLETERESIESLKGERRELQNEQEELPETPMGELDDLESRISRLREQRQSLETAVSELQSVIGFNEEMLEERKGDTFKELVDESSDNITDQLVEDDAVTCWTCGTDVERNQIETTVDRLRDLSQQKIGEVNDLEEEIDDLTDQKRDLEQAQRERERIDRRLSELEDEIASSEERIEHLQERREGITDEIESIEAEVEELEEEDYSAVLDLHKEANQLEYELGRLETELEDIEDDINDIESRIEEQDNIEEQLAEVNDQIAQLRTKIDRIESETIDRFNEHMDTVLDLLDYSNLDRIWLERIERETRKGRSKVSEHVFEIHVVRTAESGAAYEDTVDHLSESEREVTGLVFALAGYFAHDLNEEVPFVLFDSLEAVDAERVASLIEYFDEHTEYLLVSLLPEDAQALPDEYQRVTQI